MTFLKKNKINLNMQKYCFYDGVGFNDSELSKNSRGVLTCIEKSKKYYLSKGNKNTYLINHFFDNSIKINYKKKKYDIIFVGSLVNKNHFDRSVFLYKLAKKKKLIFLLVKLPHYLKL